MRLQLVAVVLGLAWVQGALAATQATVLIVSPVYELPQREEEAFLFQGQLPTRKIYTGEDLLEIEVSAETRLILDRWAMGLRRYQLEAEYFELALETMDRATGELRPNKRMQEIEVMLRWGVSSQFGAPSWLHLQVNLDSGSASQTVLDGPLQSVGRERFAEWLGWSKRLFDDSAYLQARKGERPKDFRDSSNGYRVWTSQLAVDESTSGRAMTEAVEWLRKEAEKALTRRKEAELALVRAAGLNQLAFLLDLPGQFAWGDLTREQQEKVGPLLFGQNWEERAASGELKGIRVSYQLGRSAPVATPEGGAAITWYFRRP